MPEPDHGLSRRHRRARLHAAVLAAAGAGLILAGQLMPGEDSTPRPAAQAAAGSVASTRTVGTAPATPTEVRAAWRPGAPRRLRLPALSLDAPIVPVRAPGGVLVPPRDPGLLGWWADGARPGAARGSVVIAGHSVHGAADGALEHLDRLRPGARVLVRAGHRLVRYTVTRIETLDKRALARRAERLFSTRGRPLLVLVTCGDWDGRRFLSNVVAVARPTPR